MTIKCQSRSKVIIDKFECKISDISLETVRNDSHKKTDGIFPSRPRLTCLWKCKFDRVRKSCTYVNPRITQLTVGVRLRGTVRAVVVFKVFLIASVFVTRVRSPSLVYAGTQLVSDGRAISWSVILSNLKPKVKKENM